MGFYSFRDLAGLLADGCFLSARVSRRVHGDRWVTNELMNSNKRKIAGKDVRPTLLRLFILQDVWARL
jgi:hypothetical protein